MPFKTEAKTLLPIILTAILVSTCLPAKAQADGKFSFRNFRSSHFKNNHSRARQHSRSHDANQPRRRSRHVSRRTRQHPQQARQSSTNHKRDVSSRSQHTKEQVRRNNHNQLVRKVIRKRLSRHLRAMHQRTHSSPGNNFRGSPPIHRPVGHVVTATCASPAEPTTQVPPQPAAVPEKVDSGDAPIEDTPDELAELPDVSMQAELSLAGTGYGTEPGHVWLRVGPILFDLEVTRWSDQQVVFVLPAQRLIADTKATIVVQHADNQIVDSLDVHLKPASAKPDASTLASE